MPTLAFYLTTLGLAVFLFTLARQREASAPPEATKFDSIAGRAAVGLFWATTAIFAAICIATESYRFIPPMVVLAVALTFLFRTRGR